ncbi:MAG TPA: helix-turn-helix transcriptional regulator [Clostridiales bacterium]|nr:helix-turn-helix transcriptional regulator [Clostridiales bacterium]
MNASGWSEYKLAKEAELPQSTISHLFKRNNAPTFPTIEAICGAFGMTMAQFLPMRASPWFSPLTRGNSYCNGERLQRSSARLY